MEMEKQVIHEKDDDIHLNLRLGLPGSESPEADNKVSGSKRASSDESSAPPTKTQVVGWPPVRSYRKNVLEQKKWENYVKVSMDGVPFLRKIDLKVYKNYTQLLEGLQKMFKCSTIGYNINGISSCEVNAPTYQDKDGDWMLAGDVPWHMFITSCQRMRIMKASEAKGLGCL